MVIHQLMIKFWKIFAKEVVKAYAVPDYIVYNVDNFNLWFNDKNNNAEYAHSGIFLRLDKISEHHIQDYIQKCYGIDDSKEYQKRVDFLNQINTDWKNKLSKKHE